MRHVKISAEMKMDGTACLDMGHASNASRGSFLAFMTKRQVIVIPVIRFPWTFWELLEPF